MHSRLLYLYVSIYLEKGIRVNDTENLLKHILCCKFHLFGIIINNYLIVLLDCKHSFPYNLKNLVRLTVIFYTYIS